ncbi:MAG: dihydroorotase family protein [Candidatus Diapherotrites archaeon]
MEKCLKNGKVYINGKFEETNLFLEKGKIVKILKDELKADEIIDCSGKFILPGFIDAHVHLRVPGFENKEDWKTGSRAALQGGVTTLFDMPNTKPATTNVETLEKKREVACDDSLVNFGFFLGATSGNQEEIVKAENIAGVKIYMGHTTGDLILENDDKIKEVFKLCRKISKPAVVHAEDNTLLAKNFSKAKEDDWNSVEKHHLIRNNEAAKIATEKVIKFCRENETKTHICHVSTAKETEIIDHAKKEGLLLTCEVAPHHLFLGVDSLKKLGNYGKVNPPLRENYDRGVLWNSVNNEIIDIIATDHAPHLKEDKECDYFHALPGIPELDTFGSLMLNAALEGDLSLNRVVAMCSEKPAEIFGIKNKGFIKEGFDADLIVIDLEKETEIKNKNLFTKCKWSPYNGMKLKGVIEKTLVNGNVIFENGKIVNKINGKEVVFQ